MARDILSEYGPERTLGSHRLSGLARPEPRPTDYHHPVGPTTINAPQRPGLAGDRGTNHDECGSQSYDEGYMGGEREARTALGSRSSGSPGLNVSPKHCGSQSKY